MRIVESFEDQIKGLVTYELPDGLWITLKKQEIQTYGLEAVLRRHGYGPEVFTGRVPVLQDGLMVGTLPDSFDPSTVVSASRLYDPRPTDFKRDENKILASSDLGMGDLIAVVGFKPT